MSVKINAFHLKMVAIITMFVNHIYYALDLAMYLPESRSFFLATGRLTFPIMAYLLVEGFHHTTHGWRYAGRLLIFAILSIYPFHMLFRYGEPLNLVNNVLFTLFLGLVMLLVYEKLPHLILQVLWVALVIYLSQYSDWGLHGIFLIYAFYLLKQRKWGIAASMTALFIYRFKDYWEAYQLFPDSFPLTEGFFQLALFLVIPLLWVYDGQRGPNPDWLKWGFYAFYPLHIIFLWGLRYLILGY